MNVFLLEYKIKKNGYSIKEYCKMLGIDRSTYYRKTHGISEFTQHEIKKTMEILNLDSPNAIFFSS